MMSSLNVKSLEHSCAGAIVSSLRLHKGSYVHDLKGLLPSRLLEILEKEEQRALTANRQTLKEARFRSDNDSFCLWALRNVASFRREQLLKLVHKRDVCKMTKEVEEKRLQRQTEYLEKTKRKLMKERNVLSSFSENTRGDWAVRLFATTQRQGFQCSLHCWEFAKQSSSLVVDTPHFDIIKASAVCLFGRDQNPSKLANHKGSRLIFRKFWTYAAARVDDLVKQRHV